MGETRALLRIYGMNGKAAELEALVDIGATFTKIPATAARELELEAKYETDVALADGRRVKRGLALAEVEIEEVKRPVLIAIGGEREEPLIGYTTLEILGFKVNPITGKLERTIAIEYEGSESRERQAAVKDKRRGGPSGGRWGLLGLSSGLVEFGGGSGGGSGVREF